MTSAEASTGDQLNYTFPLPEEEDTRDYYQYLEEKWDHAELHPLLVKNIENPEERINYGDLPPEQQRKIRFAMYIALQSMEGELRDDGVTPFANHFFETALIIADYTKKPDDIISALLHDVLEDGPKYRHVGLTREDLEAYFGPVVANRCERLTKITTKVRTPVRNGDATSVTERFKPDETHENIYDFLEDDPVGIVIKLADRLHNMRTLDALPRHRQIVKARETLEVYVPLATYLGLHTMAQELAYLAVPYFFANLNANRSGRRTVLILLLLKKLLRPFDRLLTGT